MEINLQLTNDHTFLTVFCIRKQTTFVHFQMQGQHSATIAFRMKSTTEVQTDSLNSLGSWRSRCQPFPASRSLCFFSVVFQEGRSLCSQCWSSFVERTSVCSSWWGVYTCARAMCALVLSKLQAIAIQYPPSNCFLSGVSESGSNLVLGENCSSGHFRSHSTEADEHSP